MSYKIIALFSGVTLLVALVVTGSFWLFKQTEAEAQARQHTALVLNQTKALLSTLKDTEIGQRSYLLTDNIVFLEPYMTVMNDVDGQLKALRQLTLNSAAQHSVTIIEPLIIAKLATMAHVLSLHNNHDKAAALALINAGQDKQLMDSIRAEMHNYIQIEERELTRHEANFQLNMRHLFILIVIASALILIFLLLFAYLINYLETQQQLNNAAHLETQHLLETQEALNQQLQHVNVILQASEEKLTVTLNSIGDAVIATDAHGQVMLLNPLAEQLTGWTQTEAYGRPVDDIFNIINKETRQHAIIPVKEALEHSSIQGLANHTVLIARDGSECDIADSCTPIKNRDGLVMGPCWCSAMSP